ncbi:MAG: peptide-methionine (R)-S-oxide reductase, partial [Bacteroidota bacterium]|nr:peptide-methionine (R)-S-oxide reductase [Bacteroidota bacterium]
MKSTLILSLISLGTIIAAPAARAAEPAGTNAVPFVRWDGTNRVVKADEAWKKELSAESYKVLRQHGTERAFSGPLANNHDVGLYRCAGCG